MYAPTAAYRVGRATENKARAVLHGAGYFTLRSWMSRSPVDVVALKAGHPALLVQVKKHGYMTPSERVALMDVAAISGGVPVLCRMESDGTLTFHTMTGAGIRDLEPLEVLP